MRLLGASGNCKFSSKAEPSQIDMATVSNRLDLEKCPHCGATPPELHVYKDSLGAIADRAGKVSRYWGVYKCTDCGGLVTACADSAGGQMRECFPAPK